MRAMYVTIYDVCVVFNTSLEKGQPLDECCGGSTGVAITSLGG